MPLRIDEVRVPTPRVRAQRILTLLEAHGLVNEYRAAGAIDPNDGAAIIRPDSVGMALTLADGSIISETMVIRMVEKEKPSWTAVVTPANLAGGTTLTFNSLDDFAVLIWTGAAWGVRGGNTAVLA